MRFLVGSMQFPIRPGLSSEPDAQEITITFPDGKTMALHILEIKTIERFVELTEKYGEHYISRLGESQQFPGLPADIRYQIIDVG